METCPVCKCQLRIKDSRIETEGDNAPDTPTKVYQTQVQTCMNDNYNGNKCPNYDVEVDTVKHLIYEGEK